MGCELAMIGLLVLTIAGFRELDVERVRVPQLAVGQ